MATDLQPFIDNCSKDHLFKSEVCNEAIKEPCIVGIDEAGRGPVLGPMVYGIAFYPKKYKKEMEEQHFADSKSLSETARERIFQKIEKGLIENFGWMAQAISPTTISNSMLQRKKYNLNLLSHDTAMMLIQKLIDAGVQVKEVYIDTVGPEKKYEDKLKGKFSGIKFTVAKKADSIYHVVSAASICAKVLRDRIIQSWKFPEGTDTSFDYGSGYPSDPKTKAYLRSNLDPIFGYHSFIRFSWSTAQDLIENGSVKCDWPDDDEKQVSIKSFQKSNDTPMFFKARNLIRISELKQIL